MTWGDNTLCIDVFTVLVNTQQIPATSPFVQAGDLTMSQLQFYADSATNAILQTNASMLAATMNDQFLALYGATFGAGTTQGMAIAAMQAAMINPQNTVCDLAGTVSRYYVFAV